MLAIVNSGIFKVRAMPLLDANGVDSLVVVVRGTFDLEGSPVPKELQTEIIEADQFWAEPESSSLKEPSDVSLARRGTDVLLQGHAVPIDSGNRASGEVHLRVGPLDKSAKVFGERVWNKRWFGMEISPPRPFERVPLRWEYSYGGTVPGCGPQGASLAHPYNPVGKGFWKGERDKPDEGLPLPQIEVPDMLLRDQRSKSRPWGFGPVARHWQPRLAFAGTYDEAWQRTRSPLLPKDFDQRFFNVAPAGQTTPEALVGGEPGEVHGVSAAGAVRFSLPRWQQTITCRFSNRNEDKTAALRSVTIDVDSSRLVLVWCAEFSCDREVLKVREVRIVPKTF